MLPSTLSNVNSTTTHRLWSLLQLSINDERKNEAVTTVRLVKRSCIDSREPG